MNELRSDEVQPPATAGGSDLLVVFDAESVGQCGNYRLGKAARHAHHGRIFFIKEVSRIVGEFEFTAKDEVLIVVRTRFSV